MWINRNYEFILGNIIAGNVNLLYGPRRMGKTRIKPLSLFFIVLSIISISNCFAQQKTDYKNTLSIRPFSVGYNRDFYKIDRFSFVIGADIGIPGSLNIDLNNSYASLKFIGINAVPELVKIISYVRYYYFTNNYLLFGPFFAISYTSSDDIVPYNIVGLDISALYGWRKIKFGLGLQYGVLTSRATNKNTVLLIQPLIINIIF